MYDVIGDIHGFACELTELLQRLGYERRHGVFHHPRRTALFCGDLIDRGPEIGEVLQIVRGMTDAGSARTVMGNHEFNALAFHTPVTDRPEQFLRPHDEHNLRQHGETLRQLTSDELNQALRWFRTLPVRLENDALRLVHACWDPESLAAVDEHAGELGMMTPEFLQAATDSESPLFHAIETVLKGPEVRLPEGFHFEDAEGLRRRRVRTRWFASPRGENYASWTLPERHHPELAALPIPDDVLTKEYPAGERPVFFGHYWMPPDPLPKPLAHNVACLDYSVAKGGLLCAYRMDGERTLTAEHFVCVPCRRPR